MNNGDKAYTTKEISDYLDIGTSTLRKWCIALEENGYEFLRTDNNRRLFFERDLIGLKYFKKLVKVENFSLENAAKTVTSKHRGEASETRTPSVLQENSDEQRSLTRSEETLQQLLEHMKKQDEHIEKQESFNKELLKRLEERDRYIEERLNERDSKLVESLRDVQETKRMIAAAREEQDNKKGFFSRLFGK
ncbi:DUF3967 domain-containing protein [Bacillus solitudinis]|uniref:DUF3967 domain-containing protein n=1 Tax=Bacillus solitudinis TaxID=2014074 RepID=UPI000C24340E|nr:DUF3967 domain-containing protein [Bacillus solitudinis]